MQASFGAAHERPKLAACMAVLASACCETKGNGLHVMKRNAQRTPSWAIKAAVASCASVVLAGCIGFGFASAQGGSTQDAESFGISAPDDPNSHEGSSMQFATKAADATAKSRLTTASTRDISKGIADIEAEEEAKRIAAEEQRRADDRAHMEKAQTAQANQLENDPTAALVDLPEVDWSVGKDAFVAEWGTRIDDYLAGSPLQGYGITFATAAWENGVDPRFSPAISNTESTKGLNCFRSHNAWGWMGDTTWSSWDESINAHVQGLAKGYGYSISLANAKKYCPPTYEDWYGKTLAQMRLI